MNMQPHSSRRTAALALAAAGIVYGDIGTSPLYALRACFTIGDGIAATPANVLGIASLIAWSLILVVSLKYVAFVMHADNRGEGGIMALMSLVQGEGRGARLLGGLGLVGAALFYGDGAITPAISVLSAVEGIEIAAPGMAPAVLPVSVAVLAGLFAIQKYGTEGIGKAFGPVMVVWFVALGATGAMQIAAQPVVLQALDPAWGVEFLVENRAQALAVLGAVVLAVTGAEALYADMGHFGRMPISLAWFGLALPGLALNYVGQAALILGDPAAVENPFYLMVPGWALYPMIALATVATVIASQAVISGVFSLTRQAIQLGFLPRQPIEHTSDHEEGQIYLPQANYLLCFAVLALVLKFQSSSALAAAYGIAVTGTMAITTVLALVVAHRRWRWPLALCLPLGAAMLALDFGFLAANLMKIPDGGWVPLAIGSVCFMLMRVWRRGREVLFTRLAAESLSVAQFLSQRRDDVERVPGDAVYLTGSSTLVPIALLHNLRHNKAMHRRMVFLRVVTEPVPRVPARERLQVEKLAPEIFRVTLHYGFFQEPDIPVALRLAQGAGLEFDPAEASFFVGHEVVVPGRGELPFWQSLLFSLMARSAARATDFFRIPSERVVELGALVRL